MSPPKAFPFSCPGCGSSYQIPADLSGARVTCEKCSTSFILPDFYQPDPGLDSLRALPVPILPAAAPPGPVNSAGRRVGNLLKNLLLLLAGAALVIAIASTRKKTSHVPSATPPQTAQTPDTLIQTPAPAPPEETPTPPPPTIPGPTIPEPPTVTVLPGSPQDAPSLPEAPATPTAQVLPASTIPSAGTAPIPAPIAATTQPAVIPASGSTSAPAASSMAPALPAAELRKNSRTALEHFLTSTTPEARLSVIFQPDKAKASLNAFHQGRPAKPLPLTELAFLTEGALPDGSSHFHLYNVFLSDQEAPIPVAVEKTADGYRVDWHTFHESYTQQLAQFCAAPNDKPGRFRVVLRRAHYFGKPVPGQDSIRIAYSIEPPPRHETFYAWVEKDSILYQEKLATGERSSWEAESYAIVELMWKGDDQRGRWIGLSRIVADNWRND